jgi:TetR/AcrR family transcriptional regulator
MNLDRKTISKQELILEAARKRFALYGVEKTTMQEIANELNMAKGSLYYYYPDKENLYKAVIESEHSEFLKFMEADLRDIIDPAVALRRYVVNRLSYFRKLVNLSRMTTQAITEYRPLITETMIELRDKERKIVQRMLDSGNKQGIFKLDDTHETASLFLDLLRGLRSTILNEKKLLFIDESEYNILTRKALEFTDIFIKGLIVKNKN